MNGDNPVLWFDNEDKTITVLNNHFLPYILKDNIKDTDKCKTIAEGVKNYDYLRTFLSDRVLVLSRDNAKAILQSVQGSQKLTEEERVRLSLKCKALSVTDNFWIKEDTEQIRFEDVNIRKNHLSDLFTISVLGTPVSLEHSILAPDIDTKGMFAKTWERKPDNLYLFKTDKTIEKINTKAEIFVSDILDACGFNKHIKYKQEEREGIYGCICGCMTNDNFSLVEADYIKFYEETHGRNLLTYVKEHHLTAFADMVIADYMLLNPDRHINNWGFIIDNKNNEIDHFAPLYDFNQALISCLTKADKTFNELIYEPTGKTMFESAKEYVPYSTIDFGKGLKDINTLSSYQIFSNIDKSINFQTLLEERWNNLQKFKQQSVGVKNKLLTQSVEGHEAKEKTPLKGQSFGED